MKTFSKLTVFLIVVLAFVVSTTHVNAQPTIQLQPYLSGFNSPILLTNAKDGSGRVFIVQQGGIVRVVQPGSTTPTDFINLTSRLVSGGERGLLGLAFHPNFASNGKFYVYYTCPNSANPTACPTSGDTIISEFAVSASNPNQGNPNSERILIKIPHPFSNHNGGMIEFGPDGYLYAGTGDGGSGNDPGNRAQNRSLLLGKMLRIDVTPNGSNPYTIPPTNPFIGTNTTRCDNGSTTSGNTCQEIFAIGLRNPFRWSFDRGGQRQLYAGDVGQGQLEELDIVTSGANMGWRVYEGTNCTGLDPGLCTPANYVPPFFEYFNSGSDRCSVTGGYVYRGRRNALPQGTYVFSDFCTGEIMIPSATPRTPTVLIPSAGNVASFGEDEQGELYVVDINGSISRIVNPNAAAPRNIVADFDGDLRTDVSVFRGSANSWYILNSLGGTIRTANFGAATDKLTPADYDGDGKTDVAVFRNGDWYWLASSNSTFNSFRFGVGTDTPVAADYDGDRKSDLAVWRGGNWFILNSASNSVRSVVWGAATDTPVPADYDGDGSTDVAVWRGGDWYTIRSSGGFTSTRWGTAGDTPVPGDYDGDGKYDTAVWRGGNWYALQSSNNAFYARAWGLSSDTPVPGDYEGDGKTDPAVTRDGSGVKNWYVLQSINGAGRSVAFGVNTDSAIPAFDVP